MTQVNIKVKFVCGCGYKTEDMLQAALHCEQTNHILTATGQIEPGKIYIKKERK